MRARHAAILTLCVLLTASLQRSPAVGHAQEDQATVRVVAPASVTTSNDKVDVSIDVENVTDLAGFQFVLAADTDVLRPISAQKTTFLANTGREIVCSSPTIEAGAIRMACVTLRLQPAGVDGAGTIATVSFKPLQNGTSQLALRNVKLLHPDGSELPSTVVNGELKVTGASWWTTPHITLVTTGIALAIIVLAGLGAVWKIRSSRSEVLTASATNARKDA